MSEVRTVLTAPAADALVKTGRTYKSAIYVEAARVDFPFTLALEGPQPGTYDQGGWLVKFDNGTIMGVTDEEFSKLYAPGRRPKEAINAVEPDSSPL